jgi:hypothetical protein
MQALVRDGFQCQAANCTESRLRELVVHHRLPRSDGGDHALSNLITLCRAHHAEQHPHLRYEIGLDLPTIEQPFVIDLHAPEPDAAAVALPPAAHAPGDTETLQVVGAALALLADICTLLLQAAEETHASRPGAELRARLGSARAHIAALGARLATLAAVQEAGAATTTGHAARPNTAGGTASQEGT